MKEIARVCISDNGEEVFIYSNEGKDLEGVYSFKSLDDILTPIREMGNGLEAEFLSDFESRTGRQYMRCLWESGACEPGMCDEHY